MSPALGKFEHGLLAHALALRVSPMFVEIGEALGGDVCLSSRARFDFGARR